MGRGLSCSVTRGICSDQGLNLPLVHWQMHSLPLSHQGSSISCLILKSLGYFEFIFYMM